MAGGFVSRRETTDVEIRSEDGRLKSINHVYYGGASRTPGEGPQAFLTERPPGVSSNAHFHNVDQFQIFFPSPGATYKSDPIDSPIFHYTDAFTTYGPYGVGPDEPLELMTLRPDHSSVTGFVPEDKNQLPPATRKRRHVTKALGDALGHPSGEVVATALIERDIDGLSAFLIEAGPGTEFDVPSHAVGAGQYSCVIDGSLDADGLLLEKQALRWDEPGHGVRRLKAGPDGVRVVVMRYPDPPSHQQLAA